MEKESKCPTFAGELHTCFVETTDEGFESHLCFDCGYTTNSALKIGTDECNEQTQNFTKLVRDLKIEDTDLGLEWYPSVINMGALGMIYPEGTLDEWHYSDAKVVPIPDEQRENYPKPDGSGNYETFLDIDNAVQFPNNKFLNACKLLGIATDV